MHNKTNKLPIKAIPLTSKGSGKQKVVCRTLQARKYKRGYPVSIRHTMATEMRRQGVEMWEIEGWLGHRKPSTSERYAKRSPDYMSSGRIAIDSYFEALQKKLHYTLKLAIRGGACPERKVKTLGYR